MKIKKKRILSLILAVSMMICMMPTMAMAAEPGETEDNPVVCTTFAEFKAAMESTTVTYVKLNGVSDDMTSRESLGAAISNTTYKVLTIEGTNTFTAPLRGNNDCLIWPQADLMINGTGTLKYAHGNTGGSGAVINMSSNVLLTINGNVTLEGIYPGATTFGRAIFAQAGTTNINGGSFIGHSALNNDYTDIDAVLIDESANVTINGGSFSASFYNATGSKEAYGLTICDTATGKISIKAGTFSQGIDIGATGKTIENCGYFDTANASITAGGSPVEATASTDVLKSTEVIVTDTSVIGSVTVAVTTPVAGAAPAAPTTSTANVTVPNYMWTIQPGGIGISSFEGGKTYRCTVLLNTASGYTFKSGATVTIGGQTATIDSQSETEIKAHVDFTTPAIPVSSVAISVTAPTAGATPSAPTTSTANVSIDGYQWKLGGNPLAEDATFEPGKTYRLEMTIHPTTGQTLSTTATATVNGQPATIMGEQTESYLNCYYEFTLPEAIRIDTIAATITPPKAGATPDMTLGLPSGVICTSVMWKEMPEETLMSSTDTYIAGRTYCCIFTIKANPEYIFANPISKVTLNGNDAVVFGQTDRYVGFEATFVATASATEYDITVIDGKATNGAGIEISKAAEYTRITLTANDAPADKVFDKWVIEDGSASITLADATSTPTTFAMPAGAVSVKATYKDKPISGGGFIPTAQKPTIEAGEGVKVTLNADGTVATITVDPGYELADVVLNGTSKGKVTEVKGLKTGDKLVVTAAKKAAEPTEPAKEDILAALADYQLVARSKVTTSPSSKKAILITWYDKNGKELNFDGVQIFRSVKRNSGYGKKPVFTSVTGKYYNTAITKGTRYYYKVRGFVVIDGQKYYTDYSLKAIRTAK